MAILYTKNPLVKLRRQKAHTEQRFKILLEKSLNRFLDRVGRPGPPLKTKSWHHSFRANCRLSN